MGTTRQRIDELWSMGYQCSQIIMIMGIEPRVQNNPDLILAMAGLSWGCGDGSCTCGSLTGACCLLPLLMIQNGGPQERQKRRIYLSTELVRWFWQKYGFMLGGIDCMAIREANVQESQSERCKQIMEAVFEKVRELTSINKLDVNWGDCCTN